MNEEFFLHQTLPLLANNNNLRCQCELFNNCSPIETKTDDFFKKNETDPFDVKKLLYKNPEEEDHIHCGEFHARFSILV